MNKILNIGMMSMLALVISGCGGSGGDTAPLGPQSFLKVDVDNLKYGYIIDGHNDAGQDVTLMYCQNQYEYYSGPGYWWGTFNIKADRINMFDATSTGGSYRVDTSNYLLEVGYRYSIDFQSDEINIDAITEDLSC